MERLYQPDFRSLFGERYTNPFLYGQIDSLIWPIFKDIEPSQQLKNLLNLEDHEGHNYFYYKQLSIEDEKVELNCSNINIGLIQAMDLGRNYGISNSDVIKVVKREPHLFKAILSFDLSEKDLISDIISELEKTKNEIQVAGIALYPSYTNLEINNKNNNKLNDLINYCRNNELFIKMDIGNLNLPQNNSDYTSYENIKSFLSREPEIKIILSGLDISGDFNLYYQLLKYFKNLWIEFDPRAIGGMTPKDCFTQLFNIKGFIQNSWHRMTIGSATPTLEISQMVRGFLEASEELSFSNKSILRTWAFRNLNRLNSAIFKPIFDIDPNLFNPIRKVKLITIYENENEKNIVYKIKLRSYSITQLIYLSNLIKNQFDKVMKENPELSNGELFIRSYHTTTSLIINEHEFGNYLDLHYRFAEISMKDSSHFFHTVGALENRADFNEYDHVLATTYGNRQLILPIVNRNLEIGNRENFYILSTFGPRPINIFFKFKLIKE